MTTRQVSPPPIPTSMLKKDTTTSFSTPTSTTTTTTTSSSDSKFLSYPSVEQDQHIVPENKDNIDRPSVGSPQTNPEIHQEIKQSHFSKQPESSVLKKKNFF